MGEGKRLEFEKGWVRIIDVPSYLRTLELVRNSATLYGGVGKGDDMT